MKIAELLLEMRYQNLTDQTHAEQHQKQVQNTDRKRM